MRQHLLTLAIAVIVSWLMVQGALRHADGGAAAAKTETVYERVMRTGTIRCGYVVYPPGLIKDANSGELSGIFHELVVEAAKRMSMKVEWVEEVNFGNYIEGLKTHRYDALCSSGWASAAESPQVLYSAPLYYSGVGVFVRADDHRFDQGVQLLNNSEYSFSSAEGSLTQTIVSNDFPNSKQNVLPVQSDVSLILLDVAAGKSDAAISETFMANNFLANNPGKIRNLVPQSPIRVFPNVLISLSEDPRFKHMMDGAFAELLNSGFVDKTLAKYEKWPNSLYRVAKPYQLSAN